MDTVLLLSQRWRAICHMFRHRFGREHRIWRLELWYNRFFFRTARIYCECGEEFDIKAKAH